MNEMYRFEGFFLEPFFRLSDLIKAWIIIWKTKTSGSLEIISAL